MYISFIQEEKDELAARLEKLEEFEEAVQGKAEDVIEELREEMRERIYESISQLFEEFKIEDNYFDEKTQEVMDEMQEYVTQNV